MFRFFSNTILTYLESDLNNFVQNTNCVIISITYNTFVYEGELMHNILLYYKIPTE